MKPLRYFLLVFVLSIPFWLVDAATGIKLLPGLPIAAFAVVCPMAAALILTYQETGMTGAVALLARSFDSRQIKSKLWYAPLILLAPCVAALSFGVLRWTGVPVPRPQMPGPATLVLFAVFLVAAIAEELGWSGYAIDPLQARWGALRASVLVGVAWAVWHYIPLLQVGRSGDFIGWWSLGTVAMRITMVWLYNGTGKSVFAVALFHAMSNLAWQLFPVHGSFFDPRIHGVIMAIVAIAVVVFRLARAVPVATPPASQ